MKSILTKVSLALLSAVFVLACQDVGTGPVGDGPQFDKPNHGTCGEQHCHDDGGEDPPQSMVTLSGGMGTDDDDPFPVGVPKETNKTLQFGNHNQTKPEFINMAFGNLNCEGFKGTNGGKVPTDKEFDVLRAKLTPSAVVADAKVTVSIVKASLGGSGNHALQVGYTSQALGLVSILLGGWPGPVEVVESISIPDEFTFTGAVVVWDREGPKDERLISCPGATVVVTLNR